MDPISEDPPVTTTSLDSARVAATAALACVLPAPTDELGAGVAAARPLCPVRPGSFPQGWLTSRATPAPCLGLALAGGAFLWVGLAGLAALLVA
jgi:hypothetical protein